MTAPGIVLHPPYLLFLDAAKGEETLVKTAQGLVDWAPERCLAEYRHNPDGVSVGLPAMTIGEAVAAGARTMVIGVASFGGRLPAPWIDIVCEALEAGLDVAAGLHDRLGDHPRLAAAAKETGRRLIDVRVAPPGLPIGSGAPRAGNRVLTVGTDCSVGKKYAALALAREMRAQGANATFRATGQTGVMIAGAGIAIDSVVADFIAGAAETVAPANAADHWDVIEGQGALFHPAYAGVSLGLLHGAQPQAFVVCHQPGLAAFKGYPQTPIADVDRVIDMTCELGRATSPDIRCVGICLNTKGMDADARRAVIAQYKNRYSLPVCDPVATGVGAIVRNLLAG